MQESNVYVVLVFTKLQTDVCRCVIFSLKNIVKRLSEYDDTVVRLQNNTHSWKKGLKKLLFVDFHHFNFNESDPVSLALMDALTLCRRKITALLDRKQCLLFKKMIVDCDIAHY